MRRDALTAAFVINEQCNDKQCLDPGIWILAHLGPYLVYTLVQSNAAYKAYSLWGTRLVIEALMDTREGGTSLSYPLTYCTQLAGGAGGGAMTSNVWILGSGS